MRITTALVATIAAHLSTAAQAIEPFRLQHMNGPPGAVFDSQEHTNGVFVLESYQLRCGPCNDNVPRFRKMVGFFAYEPRVTFIDLGIDSEKSDYDRWIARHHPTHPVLMDSGRRLFKTLGGSGTPTTWVLDCKLDVRYRHVGTWDEDDAKGVQRAIDEALKTECHRQTPSQ